MVKSKVLKFDSGIYTRWPMYYTPNTLSQAYACRKKGKVIQLSPFRICREEFALDMFNDVDDEEYGIGNRKLQCLIRKTVSSHYNNEEKIFEKQTNIGLGILNILEGHYDWPLTKMFSVESTMSVLPLARKNFMKLLVGSSKWIKSPHTSSLFLLLFRLAGRGAEFTKVKNYDQLMESCKRFAGLPRPGVKGVLRRAGSDRHYVLKTMQFWGPLMTNLDKIFRGMAKKDIYDKEAYNYSYQTEGISKLCRFGSANAKINKRFINVIKNTDIEIPAHIKRKFNI